MEFEQRLAALEAQVALLQERFKQVPDPATPDSTASAGEPSVPPAVEATDPQWLVSALDRQVTTPGGALGYGGSVMLPTGEHYEWQWSRPTEMVADLDRASLARRFDALGNPVRLEILDAVLDGARTTAELGAIPGLGTSGQLHHHLRALTSAGWLVSTGRGRYAVPPNRIIPLLTIFLATGE